MDYCYQKNLWKLFLRRKYKRPPGGYNKFYYVVKAIKELFREFDSKPFLYDVNTPDFRAFVTKLSDQNMEEIKFESIAFLREVCRVAH